MHITILGGKGRIWWLVAQHARNMWHTVTILVRHLDQMRYDTKWITIIQWDATNVNDVTKAILHADIVVHAVSVPFFHKKPTNLYARVTESVIQSRPSTKAYGYIVMSNTGTDHCRASMPALIKWWYNYFLWDVADSKQEEEALLQRSSLPWLVVKAPMLVPWPSKPYTSIPFETYTFSLYDRVSRKTIAHAILDLATSPQRCQKIVIKE